MRHCAVSRNYGTTVMRVLSDELTAELRTDAASRATPPSAPPGWRLLRRPGERCIEWQRTPEKNRQHCSVNVHANFRVIDLTQWDAQRSICESICFQITVAKASASPTLCASFTYQNSSPNVTEMYVRNPSRAAFYRGPVMRDLSPELRQGLTEYFAGLGLDRTFFEYAAQSMYYEEHQDYLAWLRDLGRFAAMPQSV